MVERNPLDGRDDRDIYLQRVIPTVDGITLLVTEEIPFVMYSLNIPFKDLRGYLHMVEDLRQTLPLDQLEPGLLPPLDDVKPT
jgi:hypothetical protein